MQIMLVFWSSPRTFETRQSHTISDNNVAQGLYFQIYKAYADIRGDCMSNDSGLIKTAISKLPFLGPLELKPTLLHNIITTLLHSDMKYLVGFPMTLKCLTFSDLEIPFYAKKWMYL